MLVPSLLPQAKAGRSQPVWFRLPQAPASASKVFLEPQAARSGWAPAPHLHCRAHHADARPKGWAAAAPPPCQAPEPGRKGHAAPSLGAGQCQPLPGKGGGEAGPSPRPIPISWHSRVGRGGPALPGRAHTEVGAAPVPTPQFFITQINQVILVQASLLSHTPAVPHQPSWEDKWE